MIYNRALSLFLILILSGIPQGFAQRTVNPTSFNIAETHVRYGLANSHEVVEFLRETGTRKALSFNQLFDLGLVTFDIRDWSNAAAIWEAAAYVTSNPNQKALALISASVARSFNKELHEAGRLANSANQLAPNVKELAAARLAYWTAVGDPLEIASAKSAISRLDISMEGLEIIEPTTTLVIVAVLIMGSITVVSLSGNEVPPAVITGALGALTTIAKLLLEQ